MFVAHVEPQMSTNYLQEKSVNMNANTVSKF